MVGYTESITDPSYKGQILLQTYPLIGNYGVNFRDFESECPKIEGYIVHELCRRPNHWTSIMSLDTFLEKHGVPGLEGIDTRALTKKIRTHGTMLGILQTYYQKEKPCIEELVDEVKKVQDPNKRDLVNEVCSKKIRRYQSDSKLKVILIDCGVKRSILTNLINREIGVIQVPPFINADEILNFKPDGILVSNGPGDPKRIDYVINTLAEILEHGIPIFGICLGAQIIALACKGNTYKLKFGHRGQNHPCLDLNTKKCYITSQNHGYAIDPKFFEKTELRITYINANDGTVEGITHKDLKISAIQWHPEASPGPNDTQTFFDKFVKELK
jgi:carbamoyl-phosphate synthase small subunit